MERKTNIINVKKIMGDNFIGYEQLKKINDKIPLKLHVPDKGIPYSIDMLKEVKKDYILVYVISEMKGDIPVNLNNLRKYYGIDPDKKEPCFYNQDWYLNEDFIFNKIDEGWYLIRKNIIEETRAAFPADDLGNEKLPSAILCAYVFFVNWFLNNEVLWKNDYVWCSDFDHNGDRIYIGRYYDINGMNKNGFSIHRHLSLKPCYGTIDIF